MTAQTRTLSNTTLAAVAAEIAPAHGFTPAEIIGLKGRTDRSGAGIALRTARWACWAALKARGYSLGRIAVAFEVHHTSVMSGIAKVGE